MQNTYVQIPPTSNAKSSSQMQFFQHNPLLQTTFMYTNSPSLCAVMAQILSIYGLVCAVIMSGDLDEIMPLHTGFLQFGAGIAVGLCGLAAGFAIGIVGDAGGTSLPHPRQALSTITPYHMTPSPSIISLTLTQSARAHSNPVYIPAWYSFSSSPKFLVSMASSSQFSCSPSQSPLAILASCSLILVHIGIFTLIIK